MTFRDGWHRYFIDETLFNLLHGGDVALCEVELTLLIVSLTILRLAVPSHIIW